MRITTQRSVRGTNALLTAVLGVSMLVLAWGISVGNVYVAVFVGVVAALCFVLVGTVNLVPDDSRSEATERTLRVAVSTLEHLRGGLTADNAQAICALLLPETNATGIAITNKTRVLACAGTVDPAFAAGSENARSTLEVLESKRMETFVAVDKEDGKDIRRLGPIGRRGDRTYGVVVPLLVQDKAVGTVKFYYARDLDIDRTQLAIGQGLGSLLSTQLSAYELDLQAELTARAEVKALQAQLNPLLPNAYQGCTVTVDVLAQAVQVKNNNVYLTADGAEFKDADGQSVAFTALSTDDTGDGAHKSSLESVFGWPED